MSLTPGVRLGMYEIVSLVGAGGMGEVYRARDTRLDRTVAIKVLSRDLAADPEGRWRLEREARTIASLSHPHVCALYDVGHEGDVDFLVMEYLEGETLASRLARTTLPVADALRHAIEIAEALDAAHRRGILHRDLKPANVMLTKAGVKLLDFGLAKPDVQPPPGAVGPSREPAPTAPVTIDRRIMGTLQYMSPEQLEGKAMDARSDLFALGAVAYEMLTGRRAFSGDSQARLTASILEAQPPPMAAAGRAVPSDLERVVMKCLAKDPDDRWQTARDLASELRWLSADERTAVPTPAARGIPRMALVGGAAAAVAVGALVVWALSRPGATPPSRRDTTRFEIHLQPDQLLPIDTGLPVILAISPDGQQVVYSAQTADGDRLYLRRLGDLEAVPIPGTEGAIGPFFSPDGQSIGFASGGVLRSVPIAGGASRTIAEAPNATGASWGEDGTIVYAPQWAGPLFKISILGGKPEPLTTLDRDAGELEHIAPDILPDRRAVLFAARRKQGESIEIVELATGKRRSLIEGRNPRYVENGHIVFGRGNAVFAAPFDLAKRELTGPAVTILSGVRSDGNDSQFAVGRKGTLVYVPEVSNDRRLVWIDRQGKARPLDAERRPYAHPRISPDGTRAVVMLSRAAGGNELWIYDLARGTRVRLSPSGQVSRPVWTSDSNHLTFQMGGSLYSAPADDSAAPQLLVAPEPPTSSLFPLAWSRDGRTLVYSAPNPTTGRDVWMLPVGGKGTPFLTTPRDERAAMLSPDGKWLVYAAKEAGREEQVYVQPYPGPGGRVVISPGGGIEPVWSPTGREIFYRSVDGSRMMAVEIRTEPSLIVGTAQQLFAGRFETLAGSYWSNYDVSSDGQQFLMLEGIEASTPRLNVFVNWTATLPNP